MTTNNNYTNGAAINNNSIKIDEPYSLINFTETMDPFKLESTKNI